MHSLMAANTEDSTEVRGYRAAPLPGTNQQAAILEKATYYQGSWLRYSR